MSNYILEAVISNVLVSSALTLVVIAATRIWKNQQIAHALWLLVLAKLVTPPVWAFELPSFATPTGSPQLALVADRTIGDTEPANPTGQGDLIAIDGLPLSPDRPSDPFPKHATNENSATSPTVETNRRNQVNFLVTAQTLLHDHSAQTLRFVSINAPAIITIWLAVSFGYFSVVVLRVIRFNRLLSQTTPADVRLTRLTSTIARQLKLSRVPEVRLTEVAVGPLVWPATRRAVDASRQSRRRRSEDSSLRQHGNSTCSRNY